MIKKLFPFVVSLVLLSVLCSFRGLSDRMSSGPMVQDIHDMDSTVAVLAWFREKDTMTYWIYENMYKFDHADTLENLAACTKVMLTVTDATKQGYRMEYSFLDFIADSLGGQEEQKIMGRMLETIRDEMEGKTVRFRTDEYGKIIKIDNLNKLKKSARTIFDGVLEELSPMDSLKSIGLNLEPLLQQVDAEELVQGYIEDLELLFEFHGMVFNTGEFTTHTDASETEYASDSRVIIEKDPENYEYMISMSIDTYIPKEDLKGMLYALSDPLTLGVLREGIDEGFDELIDEGLVNSSLISVKYFPDGWPMVLLKQETNSIGERGKVKQKFIIWERFAHE